MTKLKVSLKSENGFAGSSKYHNEVNSENFKEIAIVLKDLQNHNCPIDKAILEYKKSKGNFDILGI